MSGIQLFIRNPVRSFPQNAAITPMIKDRATLLQKAIISLVIAVLIVPRAVSLLRDTGAVLFESVPKDVDVARMREHLMAMEGVTDVHDLHAWTITSGMPSLSAHVTVTDACLQQRGVGAVLDELALCARQDFGIEHATFQVEPQSHRDHEDLGQDRHA